jgi:hypothetical protein
MKKLLIALALASTTVGCASITTGTQDTIMVNTSGCDEYELECTLTNKDNLVEVKAGHPASVEKGSNDLHIACKSDDGVAYGTTVLKSTYQAANLGNIILGGGVGLIVDAATGAMWNFPDSAMVLMRCKPQVAAQ